MGANSHLAIEYRDPKYPRLGWSTWAVDVAEDRHYVVYEALAGVRGDDDKAIVPPRGLPEDSRDNEASEYVRDISDHSLTWLAVSEYEEAMRRVGDVSGTSWGVLLRVLRVLADEYGTENVRLLIGFDN